MTAYQVFNLPKALNISSNLTLLSGAKALFELTGTTTPTDTYQDSARTTPHTNPVVANSAGVFPAIYLNPEIRYRLTLMDSSDVVFPGYPLDDVNDQLLSQAIIGALLNPITLAEIAAGVTPTAYQYVEGDAFRYGALGNDSFDNSTALTNAIAVMSAAGGGPVDIGAGTFRFNSDITLKAGVWLRGRGVRATILKYAGSGIAVTTEDVFGTGHGRSPIEHLKLTTTTSAPSLGPGTHGLNLNNASFITIDNVDIRGFSTAGLLLHADSGKACVYISIGSECHIHENAVGLLTSGANSAINAITISGANIRANANWNISNDLDVLGWSINGCSLEAGGTGGSGGSVRFNGGQGVDISGCYFEQSGGAAGLPCIDLASARATYGVSIIGNRFIGSTTGTAVQAGTSAFVRGLTVAANHITGFTAGINPQGVVNGLIAANDFTSVTTNIATPGSSVVNLIVSDNGSLKTYGAPVSQLTWDGAAWTGYPRFRYPTVPLGSVAYGSFGTSTTPVAGTVYFAELHITEAMTITGIGVLTGTAAGTDKYIVSIYSAAGTLLANSALAGTTFPSTNSLQQADFTATYAAAPGEYWIGVQINGTTDRFRTIAANTFIDVRTKSVTGSFGTLPALTPPTTFTADVGPIAYVY